MNEYRVPTGHIDRVDCWCDPHVGVAGAPLALSHHVIWQEPGDDPNAMFAYGEALGRGLSDAEARAEGWPTEAEIP